MKKIPFAFILVIATTYLHAQQGELIYRDFEPDSILLIYENTGQMSIDLDNYGGCDIKMYYTTSSPGLVFPYIASLFQDDSLQLCVMKPDSVIAENESWDSYINFQLVRKNDCYGFRFKQNNNFFYGWFKTYKTSNSWGFDKCAFCTIPNYPLRWGQTELTVDDVIENNGNDSFTIHPNPSSGVFIVTGENLKHIDIYDVLGQKVSSLNADADHTTIDLSDQPAGIYLISVTEHNGKHHTRQIVKK